MPSAAGPSASLLEAFKLSALLVIWLLDLEMTFRWRGALCFWCGVKMLSMQPEAPRKSQSFMEAGLEQSAAPSRLFGSSKLVEKNRKTFCLTAVSRNPRLPHFFLSNLFGLVVVANWVFVPAPQPFWFGITQNLAVVLTNSYAVWMCRPRAA